MVYKELAPAKLNLSLAVVGRRNDGFHQLISCVVPLTLSDALEFVPGGAQFSLVCDDVSLPTDETNLVLRAAVLLKSVCPQVPFGSFYLKKKIPQGAGLGGGSSDAAATLRLLNKVAGSPLSASALREMIAKVGSDCAFFVEPMAAVIRGRGETVQPLAELNSPHLKGRSVLLIKPVWGVPTVEAYGWLARQGTYSDGLQVERDLAAALAVQGDQLRAVTALGNDLQGPVFSHLPQLPAGLKDLKSVLGIDAQLTGSGSACFAWVEGEIDLVRVRQVLSPAWGEGVWAEVSSLA